MPVPGLARVGGRLLRTRRFVRAPIWLFEHRLGFLLGSRVLLLQHRGRKTGELRQAVLEVFAHPEPDVYMVPSGFGTRSQWFKNLQHDPHCFVTAGRGRPRPAVARRLPPDEADAALRDYIARHPKQWEHGRAVVEDTLGQRITPENTGLPIVELRLT